MPLKAVLFDMFDTLMLIEKNHEFYNPSMLRMYRYLNSHSIDVPFERFNEVYIQERDKLYAAAELNWEEPHFNVRVAATLKVLGYDYDISSSLVTTATSEFCEEFMTFVCIDPDAAAMLRKLKDKYRLGVVSNFAIPECVHKLLKAARIDRFFEVIVVSGAVNKRKPAAEIFQSALKLLNVTAAEAVFVGDTIDADIEGAKAVGMRAIYIDRRPQKPSEKFCPDQTIKSLSELPNVLHNC